MYSDACKAKSIESMFISIMQTRWREPRREQTRTVVVEVKYFSTQNDVIHTKTVNWNYHCIVQQPRWRRIFVECVALRNRVDEEDLYILLSKCFTLYTSDRPARLPSACFSLFYKLALTSISLIDRHLL